MDLRQLRYFVQIAETGNFSRAAEYLRIAQPSLSQQIRNLEDDLGVELFKRHARGVTLTDLGHQFYDHARRILLGVERARDVIQAHSSNPTGKISVGLPTSAARNFSLPLFRAIAERQPNITLHLVEAMSGYLDDFMQAGRLDVALLYDHKAFENVAWTELIVEDHVLFVHPADRIARKREVRFKDVFDEPVVLPGRPHVLRNVIETLAAKSDVDINVIDCDSLPAISKLISQEHYRAIMPHFAFHEEIERQEMVPVNIVSPTPSWRLSVVVSDRTMNPRGSAAVAAIMADVMSELVAAGRWKARLLDLNTPRLTNC
ncbi:MAG: LysR family transcriptional regulator [Shinella sp.]|jgi:LysR family transcriptional regulator, nitrogen assimilation regulatory protein|nr:LysR family transcriptional regulator [Shinella sp.]